MTFTKAARGREKAVDWSPRLWDESRLKVFETARGNKDNMYVTPWGGNTGHVFNQRQRNAFIKPITGKSCGTEPHSHFHYSLSGDSYLHLTWCLFSILFESILAISISCFIVTVVENNKHFANLLSGTVFSILPYWHIESKRPLWFVFSDFYMAPLMVKKIL